MEGCRHAEWIEVSDTANVRLVDPGRLDRLVTGLSDPGRQCPQTVICIGGEEKRRAIQDLFPTHHSPHSRPLSSLAELHVDGSRSHLEHPVFFGDCTPDAPIPVKEEGRICHETKWSSEAGMRSPRRPNDTVLTRLLFPFADSICVFAEDLGGLSAVLTYLESWSSGEVPTTIPWRARPRVSVITFAPWTEEAFREEGTFTSRLRAIKFHRHFSFVRLKRFKPQTTAAAPNRALRQFVLHDELVEARVQRKSHRVFFTARHLSWFFSRAVRHVAHRPDEPFDFIAASCSPRPLHPQYPDQLCAFLRLAVEHGMHPDTIVRVLASSVILDAYPLSGHKFCPVHVFSTVYARAMRRAFEEVEIPDIVPVTSQGRSSTITRYLGRVADQVCEWVDESDREGTSGEEKAPDKGWAVRRHLRNLKDIHNDTRWEKLRSNFSCLCCLADLAQRAFVCSHAICDTCVRRFGEVQTKQEHCHLLRSCPLCSTPSDLWVISKPPTAGVRIMSLDGGGLRAVVVLEFLMLLQSAIGRAGRIQDYFDFGFGVSAGAIIVLAVLGVQLDIAHCRRLFCHFAGSIFEAPVRSHLMLPLLQRLLGNGHYSTESVTAALQECLGSTRRLFDHPIDGVSRCKTAVTAINIETGSNTIFPSYNLSLDHREDESDGKRGPDRATYRRFSREGPETEPPLWKVIGASSAAPTYFHPIQIGEHGEYEDGAMCNPNPTDNALDECEQLYSKIRHDLILSIGAGLPPRPGSPRVSRFHGFFRACSALRLIRWSHNTLKEALNAERVHDKVERMLHGSPSADRYYRLNLELPDGLPQLDDVDSMESLAAGVQYNHDPSTLAAIKMVLIASSFYFELDARPTYCSDGRYVCSGAIRIRGDVGHVLELVRTVHSERVQFVKGAERLADLELLDGLCATCRRFNQPIRFSVPELKDSVELSLRIGRGPGQRISGFPQSIEWFVAQQGLDDPFGHAVAASDTCLCRSPSTVKPLVIRKRARPPQTKRVASKMRRTKNADVTWI